MVVQTFVGALIFANFGSPVSRTCAPKGLARCLDRRSGLSAKRRAIVDQVAHGRHPLVAQSIPHLRTVGTVGEVEATVFEHGPVSCLLGEVPPGRRRRFHVLQVVAGIIQYLRRNVRDIHGV